MKKKHFFYLLAFYFLIQTISRVLLFDTLSIDESEQIILAQMGFVLGYGSEPPLYTWIMLIFFNVFSSKIQALAICKNIMLFSSYLFMYFSANLVLKNEKKSILCVCSFFFMPSISFEAQRDLTHSVLLLLIATITLFLFLKILEKPKIIYYIFIGCIVGLGCISKYSYGIFITVLVISWCTNRNFRKLLFHQNTLLTIIIIFFITSSHFFWCYQNFAELNFDRKIKTTNSYDIWGSFFIIFKILNAIISFCAMFICTYFFIFRQNFYFSWKKHKHFLFFYLMSIAILLIIGVVLNMTSFKGRWCLPFFFSLPIYMFSFCKKEKKKEKMFIRCAGICAVAIWLILVGRVITVKYTGKYKKIHKPFSLITEKIKQNGFRKGFIVTDNKISAGNFKLYFPASIVIFPDSYKWALKIKKKYILFVLSDQKKKKSFLKFIKKTNLKLPKDLPFTKIYTTYNYGNKLETTEFVWTSSNF